MTTTDTTQTSEPDAVCYMSPAGGFGKVCNGTGSMLACQLCPQSSTCWRNTEPSPPPPTVPIVVPERSQGVLLDWSSHGPYGAAPRCNPPRPCVICHSPSNTLSPDKKVPCHKTCAEDWLQAHPEVQERKDHGPATL